MMIDPNHEVYQIHIPFTRDEWDMIHWACDRMRENEKIWWASGELPMLLNIMDRIEKNLGEE